MTLWNSVISSVTFTKLYPETKIDGVVFLQNGIPLPDSDNDGILEVSPGAVEAHVTVSAKDLPPYIYEPEGIAYQLPLLRDYEGNRVEISDQGEWTKTIKWNFDVTRYLEGFDYMVFFETVLDLNMSDNSFAQKFEPASKDIAVKDVWILQEEQRNPDANVDGLIDLKAGISSEVSGRRPGSGGNLKESFPGWVMFNVNHYNSREGEGKTLYGQET